MSDFIPAEIPTGRRVVAGVEEIAEQVDAGINGQSAQIGADDRVEHIAYLIEPIGHAVLCRLQITTTASNHTTHRRIVGAGNCLMCATFHGWGFPCANAF